MQPFVEACSASFGRDVTERAFEAIMNKKQSGLLDPDTKNAAALMHGYAENLMEIIENE